MIYSTGKHCYSKPPNIQLVNLPKKNIQLVNGESGSGTSNWVPAAVGDMPADKDMVYAEQMYYHG